MQSASDQRKGGMVAVTGLSEETVLHLCQETTRTMASLGEVEGGGPPHLAIGNYLGANNFAVSGDLDACLALQAVALAEPGAKLSRLLAVAGAFHTPLMLPAREVLSEELARTCFTPQKMSCPVLSNVTGDSCYFHHSSEDDIKSALLNQLLQPVRWDVSMRLLLSNPSFVRAYEVGPGTVCSGIVKMFNRRAKVTSYKL